MQSTQDEAHKRSLNVVKGSLASLSPRVRNYVEEKAELCQPDSVYICDGSQEENDDIINTLRSDGMIQPLPKYKNW